MMVKTGKILGLDLDNTIVSYENVFRQAARDRQGLTEARRRRPAGEGRQFGVGDGTGERGDFPALGVHDFGQLVHWP